MEQILDTPESGLTTNLNYSGFWIRAAATLIDGVFIGVMQVVLTLLILGTPNIMLGQTNGLLMVIYYAGGFFYQTLMDSSQYQGTLGKMAVGIKIIDLEGNRISFGRAVGRYFAKFLSAIILGIGYLMVAFDKKKQGLHDKLAKTYVVEK